MVYDYSVTDCHDKQSKLQSPLEQKGWVSIKKDVPRAIFMARAPGHNLVLDELRCFGCAACIAACPIDVLILEPPIIAIREESCTHCEICIPTCPVHALSITEVSP